MTTPEIDRLDRPSWPTVALTSIWWGAAVAVVILLFHWDSFPIGDGRPGSSLRSDSGRSMAWLIFIPCLLACVLPVALNRSIATYVAASKRAIAIAVVMLFSAAAATYLGDVLEDVVIVLGLVLLVPAAANYIVATGMAAYRPGQPSRAAQARTKILLNLRDEVPAWERDALVAKVKKQLLWLAILFGALSPASVCLGILVMNRPQVAGPVFASSYGILLIGLGFTLLVLAVSHCTARKRVDRLIKSPPSLLLLTEREN